MTTKRIASGLFLSDGKKVLLLKRSKKESHSGSWGLPGGKAEGKETYLDCAKRETKEETGRIPDIDIRGHIDEPIINGTFRTFVCKIDNLYKIKLSPEHSEYSWVDLKEVKKMDVHPSIRKNIDKFISILSGKKNKLLEIADYSEDPIVKHEALRVINKIGISDPSEEMVSELASLVSVIHPKVGKGGAAYYKLWKDFCNEIHRYVYKNHGEYNFPEEHRILEKAGDPHSLWYTLKEIWGDFHPRAMLEDEPNGLKGRELFIKNNQEYKNSVYRQGNKRKIPSIWGATKELKPETTKEKEEEVAKSKKESKYEKSVIKILHLFRDEINDHSFIGLRKWANLISNISNLPMPSDEEIRNYMNSFKTIRSPKKEEPSTPSTPPPTPKINNPGVRPIYSTVLGGEGI